MFPAPHISPTRPPHTLPGRNLLGAPPRIRGAYLAVHFTAALLSLSCRSQVVVTNSVNQPFFHTLRCVFVVIVASKGASVRRVREISGKRTKIIFTQLMGSNTMFADKIEPNHRDQCVSTLSRAFARPLPAIAGAREMTRRAFYRRSESFVGVL